jgi:hypothetical protein
MSGPSKRLREFTRADNMPAGYDQHLYRVKMLSGIGRDTGRATGEVFFLHVREVDGVELRFPDEPTDLPSLKVTVLKVGRLYVEETRTWSVYMSIEDVPGNPYRVQPRGDGWFCFDALAERFTVWRREHVAEGPKIVTACEQDSGKG